MLFIMVGESGSGKSYIADKIAKATDYIVVSSDQKREEWFGDAEDQTHNGELFCRIENLVKQLLIDKKDVILDATNINRKSRHRFVSLANKLETKAVAIVVHTPVEIAKERNAQRERHVPEFVIDRQNTNFQMPTKEEGFEFVFVVKNS